MSKSKLKMQDRRIDELFDQAVHLSANDRVAFLDNCCHSANIRADVKKLLHADAAVNGDKDFLQRGPFSGVDASNHLEKPGTTIGNYKLLQKIGEGGFGVVFAAEQEKPIRRRVALKIMKCGMDAKQSTARFEVECQSLAVMDHPNIVKVFDAGVTASGLPFFVMELVNGIQITQFCDEQELTIRERLNLFLPICWAIQHAHQKGINHRDIKPSNLLIGRYDGDRVPKVIDFGIAKAIRRQFSDKATLTQFGQVIVMLEYMSPEQSSMNRWDVDERSDIYSLGAV